MLEMGGWEPPNGWLGTLSSSQTQVTRLRRYAYGIV